MIRSLRVAALVLAGCLVAFSPVSSGALPTPAATGSSAQSRRAPTDQLQQAAAKAAADVQVLQKQLDAAKAADAAAKDAAQKKEADLASQRDQATQRAAVQKQKVAEMYAEVLKLAKRESQTIAQLRVARQVLRLREATFREWAVSTFVHGSDSSMRLLIDPTDLSPSREAEIRRQGGEALRELRDRARQRITDLEKLRKQLQAKADETRANAKVADNARKDAELEASSLEEERLSAVESETERQTDAVAQQNDLTAKVLQATAMSQKFGQLGLDENTAIAQPPVLDAWDLYRWFASTGRRANITVPMSDLTQYFIAEGQAEGIRGDIAFAQSILETGSFSFPPWGQLKGTDNNYAGIGACDSCANGFGFPTAQAGVRAQMQLLKVYATPGLTSAGFANPSVRWVPEKLGIRGCCLAWSRLATVWASTSEYFYLIKSVWSSIVNWVAADYLKNGPPGTNPLAGLNGAATAAPGAAVTTTTVP